MLKDCAGQKYHKLLAIKRHGAGLPVKWECVCECGGTTIVAGSKLRSGWTKSCGCLQREAAAAKQEKHGWCHRVNGKRTVPDEYNSWYSAKDRCYNPKNERYYRYGGRGIKMSDAWVNDFGQFMHDMGRRPPNFTLERINNDGNYEASNCKWASREEQANNRRTNNRVECGGTTKTIAEWSKELGVNQGTMWYWLKNGATMERIISKLSEITEAI